MLLIASVTDDSSRSKRSRNFSRMSAAREMEWINNEYFHPSMDAEAYAETGYTSSDEVAHVEAVDPSEGDYVPSSLMTPQQQSHVQQFEQYVFASDKERPLEPEPTPDPLPGAPSVDEATQQRIRAMDNIDWSQPDAFERAVDVESKRLFADGVSLEVMEDVAITAFVSFVGKLGAVAQANAHSVANSKDIGISSTAQQLYSEAGNVFKPVSKSVQLARNLRGRVMGREDSASWKVGPEDLARRYMHDRALVLGPRASADIQNTHPDMQRLQWWMAEGKDKSKIASAMEALKVGANDKYVFLRTQFDLMELLYDVFCTMMFDFHSNPGSWRKGITDNVRFSLDKHIKKMERSRAEGKIKSTRSNFWLKSTSCLAVTMIAAVHSGYESAMGNPVAYMKLAKNTIKLASTIFEIGIAKRDLDARAVVAGQVSDVIDSTLARVQTLAENEPILPGLKQLMPEFAAYRAVIENYEDGGTLMPKQHMHTILVQGDEGRANPKSTSKKPKGKKQQDDEDVVAQAGKVVDDMTKQHDPKAKLKGALKEQVLHRAPEIPIRNLVDKGITRLAEAKLR